eukprot:TRINITY_DN2511_c0_g1_i1.p1 TRINITY_DN2511_c0_g1~~TRINITY_DN2511_c0_g1_i1.p1  ORF type:complete len:805 (-),score=297.06 TRINITY_DN2511_c0_g1_i1:27-2441(-)
METNEGDQKITETKKQTTEESLQETPSQLKGWLRKQGEGKLKVGWKKRYFKQVGQRLSYYTNETDTVEQGFIDLDLVSQVNVTGDVFIDIIIPGRAYHLAILKEKPTAAENKADLAYWAEGLGKYAQENNAKSQVEHLEEEKKGLKPMKGWLRKFGEGTLKQWKRRYFRQDGRKLYFFASETDKDALGFIDLAHVLRIERVSDIQFDLLMKPVQEQHATSRIGSKYNQLMKVEEGRIYLQLDFLVASQGKDIVHGPDLADWVLGFAQWLRYYNFDAVITDSSSHSTSNPTPTSAPTSPEVIKNEVFTSHGRAPSPPSSPTLPTSPKLQLEEIEKELSAIPLRNSFDEIQVETVPQVEPVVPSPENSRKFLLNMSAAVIGLMSVLLILPRQFLIGVFVGILAIFLVILSGVSWYLFRNRGDGEKGEFATQNLQEKLENFILKPAEEFSQKSTEETYIHIINSVVGRVFREHAHHPGFREKYRQKLNLRLSSMKKPGFLRSLELTEFDLGDNIFEIVNTSPVKLVQPESDGELRVSFRIRYVGNKPAHVSLSAILGLTSLASVPVSISVFMEQIEGDMLFVMPPGEDPVNRLAFTHDPISRWKVVTKIGSKMTVVPRVSQFFEGKLQQFLKKDMILPNGICFHFPIKNERQLKIQLLRKLNQATSTPTSTLTSTSTSTSTPTSTPTSSLFERSRALSSESVNKIFVEVGSPIVSPASSPPLHIFSGDLSPTSSSMGSHAMGSISEPATPSVPLIKSGPTIEILADAAGDITTINALIDDKITDASNGDDLTRPRRHSLTDPSLLSN